MVFSQYVKSDALQGLLINVGKLVNFLQNRTHITKLSLVDCKINTEGVKALANLTNLTSFGWVGNNISEKEAKVLAKLTNLTSFGWVGNNISEKEAKVLAKLTNFTELNLANKNIDDKGIKALANLTNLTKLNLSCNNIGEKGAEALAKLTNLTELDLGYNKIGEEGVKALANGDLTNLTKLNLANNKIGEEGVKALANLTNLTELNLTYSNISIKEVEALAKLTNLTKLNLANNKIDDKKIKALANLTNLTKLNLSCNNIGEKGVKALANLTNLTELDLIYSNISIKEVEALAKLTNLTKLNLGYSKISEEGVKALAKLTNLTKLNLGYSKISEEGVKALAKLTNLTELNLGYSKISEEGVKALAKLTNLTELDLCGERNDIGNEGAKALAESKVHLIIDQQNYYIGFYERLKALWSQARAKSNGNVGKLDENSVKRLFFDLAQQNRRGERIKLLLDDSDKYPFLINSRDEQGHTLSYFYTHSPEMQEFFFERGMVPKEERNQRRDDERIAQDNQSVHASPIVKRTNFFAKKLVESTKASEEQLKQAAASYVESIELLKQYQNDPIKLGLLNLTDYEKRSVMEKTLSDNDSIPNDKEFVKAVIDKTEQALVQQYLRKNYHGEYDQGYPRQELQYDYTRDDAKVTIPESIGYIKLLIDNFSIPLQEKKELLATLMEQNSELVRGKLSIIRKELGNSDILNEGQFKKTELHGLLNGIDDDKKINKLFKEISGLDIEKVWREQKEFVLLKQIYTAATTYGENSSACTQGTWSQIISSINEISSEIVTQYDHYLEEEQKLEAREDVITKENIQAFLEGLANKLIQHVELHPELKKALEDFALVMVDITKPEEITFEQQKILAEINKYLSENIKDVLRNYNKDIPSRVEYSLVIKELSNVKAMQDFAQEPSNLQENIIREAEAQIDENSDFDAEDNSESYVPIIEGDTDEEFYDANESIFPEKSKTLLVPERLQPENSVIATDQKIGIQNNNRQPSPRIEKKTIVAAPTLTIAGVALGVAIAVYLEMLAVGIVVGAICCIGAAAIIYYCNRPSSLLENSSVQGSCREVQ